MRTGVKLSGTKRFMPPKPSLCSPLLLQNSRQELRPVLECRYGSACGDSAAKDRGRARPRRHSAGLGARGLRRCGSHGVSGRWRCHGQAGPAWGWKAQACAPAKGHIVGGSGFGSSGERRCRGGGRVHLRCRRSGQAHFRVATYAPHGARVTPHPKAQARGKDRRAGGWRRLARADVRAAGCGRPGRLGEFSRAAVQRGARCGGETLHARAGTVTLHVQPRLLGEPVLRRGLLGEVSRYAGPESVQLARRHLWL